MFVFLEQLLLNDAEGSSNFVHSLIFSFLVWAFFYALFWIGIYVYTSIAYMSIAKKAKYKYPGFAWIPFFGKPFLASRIAKMHWWPMLFLPIALIFFILGLFFAETLFILFFMSLLPFLAFFVFWFIWHWKTFEVVGKSGWWILLYLIPFFGLWLFLIFLGISAWSGEDKIEQIVRKKKNNSPNKKSRK